MNRIKLIDRFKAWLKTNPSLNIAAAQCATIAEEAYVESMTEVYGDIEVTIGTVIETTFRENELNSTFEVRGIVDDYFIVCLDDGEYNILSKNIMEAGLLDGALIKIK